MLSFAISNALQIIDRRLAHIVVVAPTGAGKSLLWQLPALAFQDDLTPSFCLLVLPYVALIEDVKRTCAALGIKAGEWDGESSIVLSPNKVDVVLVSMNRAVTTSFLDWASRNEVRAAISRVVVDEIHVLFDELFRGNTLNDFSRLTECLSDKQFVFCSATVPPTAEAALEAKLLLPVRFLRDFTHRPNLVYSVVMMPSREARKADILARATRAAEASSSGSHPGQTLVICRSQHEAYRVASLLNCKHYRAPKPEDTAAMTETLQDNLDRFLQGHDTLLVGTTALGVGIDRPCIRLVAFWGDPYSMASFAQGSGRAGRDGAKAEVIIYRAERKEYPAAQGLLPRTDGEALGQLLSGVDCLREPINEWMDGRVANCIELGAELCSSCQEDWSEGTQPAASPPDASLRLVTLDPSSRQNKEIERSSFSGQKPSAESNQAADANSPAVEKGKSRARGGDNDAEPSLSPEEIQDLTDGSWITDDNPGNEAQLEADFNPDKQRQPLLFQKEDAAVDGKRKRALTSASEATASEKSPKTQPKILKRACFDSRKSQHGNAVASSSKLTVGGTAGSSR
ncbi:hypothetical protein OC835_007931 [Tilletia horrida]|nr:hypothetical protein OC835_007931 [Tilletia horrida]